MADPEKPKAQEELEAEEWAEEVVGKVKAFLEKPLDAKTAVWAIAATLGLFWLTD